MKRLLLHIFIFTAGILSAQTKVGRIPLDTLPSDLPLPTITTLKNPSDGYIFAALPYWGTGGSYLVMYNNRGEPVFFKKTPPQCTDFKLHDNGLLTYFDGASRKFFALDSTFSVVDSFWVQNGFTTDEHDIKFLKNGNVFLIGYAFMSYDMSQVVPGGDRNASVVVDVVQEIDKKKTVVLEWKAYEHYKLTDVGPEVNLTDPSFLHSHINSIDFDLDSNLVVSARNLDEITKIDRKSGNIVWRLGGKNNQFKFINDSIGFNAQHAASILPNGNLILFDNGPFHAPHFSRVVEYRLDTINRTATRVWSYRNSPDVASIFWGNAQRLKNGNTFIGWGKSDIAATEVNSQGEKVFEMSFATDVYSYRVFRFPLYLKGGLSYVEGNCIPTNVRLQQNYPNPFNPMTTIIYEVSKETHIVLKVFDILGREAVTLENQIQQAGRHTAVFSPKDLPSGIYICRIQAGNEILSRSMLYLK